MKIRTNPKESLKAFCPDHAEEIDLMTNDLAAALHAQICGIIEIGERAIKILEGIQINRADRK